MEENVKGKRISSKKVNSDKFLQFHEFLMYDPNYRDLPDKAKLLYMFLRSKVPLFESKQEAFENGEPGSKSYADENGDIFILADNSELIFLFQCSEPTIIKMKKALEEKGLLDEEQQKWGANRIYPLMPPVLAEEWNHIKEIIELRESREQERKEKALKVKEKKKKEKLEKKINKKKNNDLKILSHGKSGKKSKNNDLKNLSHHNLKNLSHHDLKNLSQLELNGFNIELNTINENLSVLQEKEFMSLLELLDKRADLKTHTLDIINFYKIVSKRDNFHHSIFMKTLEIIYLDTKPFSYFKNAIDNNMSKGYVIDYTIEKKKEPKQPIRKEYIPDWWDEEDKPKELTLEEKKQAMAEKLAAFRK